MASVDQIPLSELITSSSPGEGSKLRKDDDYRKRIVHIMGMRKNFRSDQID